MSLNYILKDPNIHMTNTAEIVDISSSCICPNCEDTLSQFQLSENEKLLVRVALMKISSTVSQIQWKNLQVALSNSFSALEVLMLLL